MYRPRFTTFVAVSILVLFSIYLISNLASFSRPQIVKSPGASHPDIQHVDPDPAPTRHADLYNEDHKTTLQQEAHTKPTSLPTTGTTKPSTHQVDDLMKEADATFKRVLSKQVHNLEDAAAAYRARRGRHPPPSFDKWYHYAKENNVIIVEEFWDQIYHDLNPFWAIEPAMLRTQARKLGMGAEVKGGKVVKTAKWFWHEIWGKMIDTFAKNLPDMFIAMNPMDESRLLVKWEHMNELMTKANKEKSIVTPSKVVNKFQGWTFEGKDPDFEAPPENWNGFNPYNYARRACPPDSHARQISGILSPDEILAYHNASKPRINVDQYFDEGFVSNYTQASDFCTDASIGGLHGALMMPLTCQNSDVLMPMFGGSKFHVNNEILLPAPMYWNGEERFGGAGGDPTAWEDKDDKVVWRGTATGGRNKPFNWYMFHRHRFVAMANGTRYAHADKEGHDLIFNQLIQKTAIQTLKPEIQAGLADWLRSTHDVAFTDLVCDENEPDGSCWYTKDEFAQVLGIQFNEQFATKYLPDIDGNSFSGRYRAFLLSNSLPIKATIYREWHDSRLFAWKHFVPMNNRFSDYYRILEYFMGDVARGIAGRDDQAKKIAVEGRVWSEKVLRKEDMQAYTFRLLLEYGRLMDDNRLMLGWADDLLKKSSTADSNLSSPKGPIEEPGA